MSARRKIVIVTRRSRLARAQTDLIVKEIRRVRPDLDVDLRPIVTRGDLRTDKPLPQIGGKGLFTYELEQALLSGQVDLAVHSAKDLPTEQAEGLDILCVPKREAVNDCLVSRNNLCMKELPSAATIGTGSLRRQLQIRSLRPDLNFAPIRGNIDTRIKKVREGQYEAAVLASAGLRRAGLAHEACEVFSLDDVLPAPGQAALAIQGKADDDWLRDMLSPINDAAAADCLLAERRVVALLGLTCQMPFAALAERAGGQLRLRALLIDPEDGGTFRADVTASGPDRLAEAACASLRTQGAAEIIRRLSGSGPPG